MCSVVVHSAWCKICWPGTLSIDQLPPANQQLKEVQQEEFAQNISTLVPLSSALYSCLHIFQGEGQKRIP